MHLARNKLPKPYIYHTIIDDEEPVKDFMPSKGINVQSLHSV